MQCQAFCCLQLISEACRCFTAININFMYNLWEKKHENQLINYKRVRRIFNFRDFIYLILAAPVKKNKKHEQKAVYKSVQCATCLNLCNFRFSLVFKST